MAFEPANETKRSAFASLPLVREEAFSFFTHFGGALLALAGIVFLVLRASGAVATTAVAIYGTTLFGMFLSSALHHFSYSDDGIFRRLDMTAIYLFIAGTYTPVCLLAVPPTWGFPLLAVVWSLAIIGIVLRWIVPITPPWVTVSIYLGISWIGVVGIYPLFLAYGWSVILPLAAGGILYTVGAIVYAAEKPDPWPSVVGHHGLWHVFVIVAAALHFWTIWILAGP